MENVLKILAKSVLIPLGSTAVAASAIVAAIHKKIFESGRPSSLTKRKTLIISK